MPPLNLGMRNRRIQNQTKKGGKLVRLFKAGRVTQLVFPNSHTFHDRHNGRQIGFIKVSAATGDFECILPVKADAHFLSWTHCELNIIDVTATVGSDTVGSYFGMADYKTRRNTITVSRDAVYLRMLLDQGYSPDSGLTYTDEDAILLDIQRTIEGGFNGIRKHQKTEDERFYYYCDILGLYVWLEMPSAYVFGERMMRAFEREYLDVVEQYSSHPCIMSIVIFNESWGLEGVYFEKAQQRFAEGLYYLTKAHRPDKLVVGNDGWENTRTDIITIHNYVRSGTGSLGELLTDLNEALCNNLPGLYRSVMAEGCNYEGQPIVISEFGGMALQSSANNGWGYGPSSADAADNLAVLEFYMGRIYGGGANRRRLGLGWARPVNMGLYSTR